MLESFEDWLEKEWTGKKVVLYILAMDVAYFLVGTAIIMAFEKFGIGVSSLPSDAVEMAKTLTYNLPANMIGEVVLEELLFRAVPLFLAVWLGARRTGLLVVILISSAIFGAIHGNLPHVFIQGFFGVIASVGYLKFGGMDGKILKPFTCVTVSHFLYDCTMFLL